MKLKEIKSILKSGENISVEFKESNNKLPKDFGKINPDNFTPIAKNPIISKLMLLMGRVEEVGSGIHNVKKYLPHYDKNAKYEFIDADFFSTIIYFDKETAREKLGEKLGERLGEKWSERWSEKWSEKLNENQQKIIENIKNNPYITISELSSKLKLSTTAIENNIKKLKDKGIIKRIGPAKGGHWEIINQNKKDKE